MTASSANAATYDAARVGTVAKSDVMNPLGLNESAFQGIVKTSPNAFTFKDVFTATTDTTWGCSDGSVQHHYRNTILTSPINATPIFNGSANKVTGWTLTGKGASVITENNTGGTRFPNCSPLPRWHVCGLLPVQRGAEPLAGRVVRLQRHVLRPAEHRGRGGSRRLIHPHHSSPRPARVGGLLRFAPEDI